MTWARELATKAWKIPATRGAGKSLAASQAPVTMAQTTPATTAVVTMEAMVEAMAVATMEWRLATVAVAVATVMVTREPLVTA